MTKEEGNFFEHRYFVINKRFMSHIGAWPFQDAHAGGIRHRLFFISVSSSLLLEIIRAVQYWPNFTNIFAILPYMLARICMFIKWYNFVLQQKKMRSLLHHIQYDWENIRNAFERMTMETYGQIGRQMVIYYIGFIYVAFSVYTTTPFTPIILDFLMPLNQSREKKLIFDAEYFVDPYEYYYYVSAHAVFTTMVSLTIIVAVDAMYVIYGNHVCSQFAVTCYRLENIFESSMEAGEGVYIDLVISVQKHKRAIEFTSNVEATFRLPMLFQVMVCVMCASITTVQTVKNLDNSEEVIRLSMFTCGQMCHLFFLNYPGQRVLDHSNQVFQSAYYSNWYNFPLKAQKLLQVILLRSMTPCVFTAGKICVLSMEMFVSVIQTAMSYFTVLSSV